MKARILFGTVQVYNTRTGKTELIPDIIHVEGTDLEEKRNYILCRKPPKERDNYNILEFNTQTAKELGVTNYDIQINTL